MAYRFQKNSKFAFLAVNNVYLDLPDTPFQLSDGTWIISGLPVPHLGVWEKRLGSIRLERLSHTNLGLIVEEPSVHPGILDDAHKRLSDGLGLLFEAFHFRAGLETDGTDLLIGSSVNGVPEIRQVCRMPRFYQSKGYTHSPITWDWLEDSLVLSTSVAEMKGGKTQFRRVAYGLNTLFKGLREQNGQDRLHQFVRSLEALILPTIGSTRADFAHRCKTFAGARNATYILLKEAYDLRSATEHLHAWDRAVQRYPLDQQEDVCWQRTRQIEHLACDAYSRLLRDPDLRERFRAEDTITAFWKLRDDERRVLWGTPLDIAQEPFVQEYDQWGRATR